ncbi:MAG: hypothetical protein ACTHPD_05025 [Rhizomicrobium sp.]
MADSGNRAADALARRIETEFAMKWLLAGMAVCLFSTCCAASPARFVSHNIVISHRDPAVEIKLPAAFHYVGTENFFLSKPELGKTEHCTMFVFVDAPDGHHVRRYVWVQFEEYLPGHPELHLTYNSPRHANLGGLDFYEDEGVSHATKIPKPGSDGEHFYGLLASHGYQRTDLLWTRLVHLPDPSNRKELMIIYAESLAGSGYTAAQLDDGGPEHARWTAIDEGLRERAEHSIKISAAAK